MRCLASLNVRAGMTVSPLLNVLDGQQHLLAVLTHAEHNQEHDRGGLAIEPDPHHGAIEDQADDRLVRQRAGIPGIPVSFLPSATPGSPYPY